MQTMNGLKVMLTIKMNKSMIIRLSCIFLALSWVVFDVLAKEKPNVIIIFADDLGYGDLSCYGATKVKTPNIDKLAKGGMRFTDAHSASSVCTPSRYALITGEYPHRKNISRPIFLKSGLIVDEDQLTIADVMKSAGYATACFGKWHLGFGEKTPNWNGDLKPGPLELGFDHYYGVPTVNSHPPFVYVEDHRVVGLVPEDPFVYNKKAKTQAIFEKMHLNGIGGADAAHELYDDYAVGTHLTEKSTAWIRKQKQEPFFMLLATTHIHHPFTPAKRFQGTSECGLYGDFIHELDWMVGEISKTLEEQGIAENTLIIFTSDNGGMLNETGQEAWKMGHHLNGELMGFKFDAWEGGHRVPFIVNWKGHVKAGSVSDELISNIDLLATLASINEIKVNKGQARDSLDMLKVMTGEATGEIRKELVLAPSKRSNLALRQGKWMYIGDKGGGGFASRKEGSHGFGGPAAFKFHKQVNSDIKDGALLKNAPPAQLYNLEDDLSQDKNVFNEHPELVKELNEKLNVYRQQKH